MHIFSICYGDARHESAIPNMMCSRDDMWYTVGIINEASSMTLCMICVVDHFTLIQSILSRLLQVSVSLSS